MTDSPDQLARLIGELCQLPDETEWLEFKVNKNDPAMIGRGISALGNSAALEGKTSGYLIWGIEDGTHARLGTTFEPQRQKKGNEDLENWLLRLLKPKIDFSFAEVIIEDKRFVILQINRAEQSPIQFEGIEYIRVGSHTKKLKEHPERERKLWRIFDRTPFEKIAVKEDVTAEEVTRLLDYSSYFNLIRLDLPSDRAHIIERLQKENLIRKNQSGRWDILNLGAILFAHDLRDFGSLGRKAVRFIHYGGNHRAETLFEPEEHRGYASCFVSLIGAINSRIPHNEVLGAALRKEVPMFPGIAVRELVANALIHQDFFQTGTGPMIELFETRLEISNPGKPLIDVSRFLDSPPKSRNEDLASLLRRLNICEERGSGIDKVVLATEEFQLPAPLFETTPEHTRTVLFAHKDFEAMSTAERVKACYLHACLRFLMHDYMSNESLRERFGLPAEKSYNISRIITATKKKGLIVPAEEGQSNKYARYVPHWCR